MIWTGIAFGAVIEKSTIDSEGFKGGTRGSPIMPRDTVSRTANVGTVGKIHRAIYIFVCDISDETIKTLNFPSSWK